MKVVDIERVVILMRFIQFGWNEDRKKRFDDDLKMMLETQCEDLEEHDAKVRADAIDEVFNALLMMVKDGYDYPNEEFKNMFIALVEDAIDSIKKI